MYEGKFVQLFIRIYKVVISNFGFESTSPNLKIPKGLNIINHRYNLRRRGESRPYNRVPERNIERAPTNLCPLYLITQLFLITQQNRNVSFSKVGKVLL
jgi:hypothetical protein